MSTPTPADPAEALDAAIARYKAAWHDWVNLPLDDTIPLTGKAPPAEVAAIDRLDAAWNDLGRATLNISPCS